MLHIKKIAALFTVLALAVVFAMPHAAQAYFWRNAGEGSAAATSPGNPTIFGYGYGSGSSGFGYGYGYGYSFYTTDKVGTGYYYGATSAVTSVALSSDRILTGSADYSSVIVNNAFSFTGTGTETLTDSSNENILVTFPAAATLTATGGTWDGIFEAPNVVPSDDTTNYNATYATYSDIYHIGSRDVTITASAATTVDLPIARGYDTAYTWIPTRIPVGSTTPVALTACASHPVDSDGVRYCRFTTTSFSRFYIARGALTSDPTVVPGGGGGGGGNLPKCRDKETDKLQNGTADKDGFCKVTAKKEAEVIAPKATDVYAPGEVAPKFTDTKGHWAEGFIETLRAAGIVHGKRAGKFGPDDQLTRAEITKIALNAFSIPVNGAPASKPFSDVAVDAWYAPYIAKAKELKIVEGYNNGTFKPNQSINRAEAMKILLVASGLSIPMDTLSDLASQGWTYIHFLDVPINAWFAAYVDFAFTNGIVSGYGNGMFGPGDPILRGQMAKMAVNSMNLAK